MLTGKLNIRYEMLPTRKQIKCSQSKQTVATKARAFGKNSFLKNDVGDYELWAGAPARLIRKLEK